MSDHLNGTPAAKVSDVQISDFLYRAGKARNWAPATMNQRYRSLRRFFGWLVTVKEIDANPLQHLAAPKIPRRLIQALRREDVKRMLALFDREDPLDVCDHAIVLALIDTGLRASELLSMRAGGEYSEVTVMGKGSKERTVYLGVSAREAVANYADSWRLYDGPLWRNRYLRPLTMWELRRVFVRLEGGDGPQLVHPPLMRHSFASLMLAQQAPESAVVTLAGWDDPTMFRRYTHSQEIERARDVHRRYSPGDWVSE